VKKKLRNLIIRLLRTTHVTDIETAQRRLAFLDSQQFIYDNSSLKTLSFSGAGSVKRMFEYCVAQSPEEGLILELGVFRGESLRIFASAYEERGDERPIFGFDSWQGFSEDWSGMNESFPRRLFDQQGTKPQLSDSICLIDGFIEETLPKFLREHTGSRVALVHIDTDTYTPARVALELLKPLLRRGSIIIFDELCGYPNWRSHEFKALQEMLPESSYDFIGFAVEPGNTLIKGAIQIRCDL